MTSLLTDPIVLICVAVIVLGLFGFFWGVSKLRKVQNETPAEIFDEPLPVTPLTSSFPIENEFRARPPIPQSSAANEYTPASTSTPAISREVADRLESMTQRLSEMQ